MKTFFQIQAICNNCTNFHLLIYQVERVGNSAQNFVFFFIFFPLIFNINGSKPIDPIQKNSPKNLHLYSFEKFKNNCCHHFITYILFWLFSTICVTVNSQFLYNLDKTFKTSIFWWFFWKEGDGKRLKFVIYALFCLLSTIWRLDLSMNMITKAIGHQSMRILSRKDSWNWSKSPPYKH